jgi:hypothetical protein
VSLAVGHGTTTVVSGSENFNRNPIRVRRHVMGRSWGPTHLLGSGATDPVVASNRANVTVAAWWAGPVVHERVVVARRDPGRPWGGPHVLRSLPAPRQVTNLHVAVGANGAAVVWWDEMFEEEDPPDLLWAYVSQATPSGAWQTPHLLVRRTREVPQTTVAIGARGNLTAVYSAKPGLLLTRRVVGRGWTRPRVITPGRGFAVDPLLMRTRRGGVLVVAWTHGHGFDARRRINGRWEAPKTVVHTRRDPLEWDLDAGMDGVGNVTFCWRRPNDAIQARRWQHGKAMGARQTLIGRLPRGSFDIVEPPQIAVGARGETVLAYTTNLGFKDGSVRTLYRPRGGPWGPQQVLSKSGGTGVDGLALRPSGDVEAVWSGPHRLFYSILRRP